MGYMGSRNSGGAADRNQSWQYHANKSAEQVFRDIFRDFEPFSRSGFAETEYGFDATQQASINVTFEEAVTGITKDLMVNVIDSCGCCAGTGVQLGYKKVFKNLI